MAATPRRGYAGIKSILDDMLTVLPPENTSNAGYMRVHTTFGLLSQTHRQAEDSADPARQYRALAQLEAALRQRLHDLQAKKGVPAKMAACLDELRDAVRDALEEGVDAEFVIRGVEEELEKPEATAEERARRRPERMVAESRFKKVWEELKAEKRRTEMLNRENNELVLRLKVVEAERDRLRVLVQE